MWLLKVKVKGKPAYPSHASYSLKSLQSPNQNEYLSVQCSHRTWFILHFGIQIILKCYVYLLINIYYVGIVDVFVCVHRHMLRYIQIQRQRSSTHAHAQGTGTETQVETEVDTDLEIKIFLQ